MTLQEIRSLIRDVPDFPKPGIVFKDITPLLAHPAGFSATIDRLAERAAGSSPDGILAIESRGFIFGAALANRLRLPLQLVRKSGKLPRESISTRYELEYGFDHLEVHADAIEPAGRYLIVDDVIATGGTAAAAARLVRQQQGIVASCMFVLELSFLNGREALGDLPVVSLLRF
ncbi:adenine phosphoribosyltransferase [Candidatus Rariloculus sp.]|uniref:adenine phosphoribosyltransferase n=1 Tax=Candidatus Rariloculus sp. TaxID=3101265 RepID=UPI003D123787